MTIPTGPHPSRDQLAALSDGSLTSDDAATVESHVVACDQCAATLGELATDDKLVSRLRSAVSDDPAKTSLDTAASDAIAQILKFLEPATRSGSLGRLGHYEIEECLGRGAFGIVLKAFDDSLQRVVAVKVLAPEMAATSPARKRFLREARSAAQIRHENVVQIHAVEEQPLPYLVMEYIPGETLQERLDRIGPLDVPEVLRLGCQMARGLAAAHTRGLIHRDIKPGNILLEKGLEERVKITDFGLARAADDASLTQSGIIAGTPMFMAPEQARGETIDQRADLFSLGSVFYTMVSGHPPFRASNTVAVLKRVCDDTPRPIQEVIPETPQWLCEIIGRLQSKNAEDRFQNAKEVADLLSEHLAHLPPPSKVALPKRATPTPRPGAKAGASGLSGPGRRRRWATAAAMLLCLLAGLGFTEATGVTRLVPTVIRIFTPDGTLVVETDDPGVKVTIEGDGGLTITGAGLHEVRLKPGSYKLQADKDGQRVPLERELISIAKGGREVVRVKLEAPPAQVIAKADKGPFVLLSGKGVVVGKHNTLADAVKRAGDGDTIEIRGNGPFVTDPLEIDRKALTIRAGSGYAPVIRPSPAAVKADAKLLRTDASLTLEGLELHYEGLPETSGARGLIGSMSAPLYLTNCKLVINPGKLAVTVAVEATNPPRGQIRNCLVVSPGNAFAFHDHPRLQWTVDNCLIATTTAFYLQTNSDNSPGTKLRLSRNTLVSLELLAVAGPEGELADRLRDPAGKPVVPMHIEVEENLCQALGVLSLMTASAKSPQGLPVEEQRRALPKVIHWRERSNVYGLVEEPFLNLRAPATGLLKDLSEWNQLWGLTDTGSVQGSVRLRGNPRELLAETPEAITVDDFRLRPDSAGYKAGKDKKDLGADVDLVGPGAAYERWKKTPEYWQWLRETGQLRAEVPDAEPNAFVLLGGSGAAERKFNTLAEAVKSAASGDTIEIRGNGPFISPPVRMEKRALAIRAGEGFRPSIWLEPDGTTRAGTTDTVVLLETDADLTLEGLELRDADWRRRPGQEGHQMVFSRGPALRLLGCRLQLLGMSSCLESFSRILEARNCEFLSQAAWWAVGWDGEKCLIDNCLIMTAWPGISLGGEEPKPASVRLTRNTVLCNGAAISFEFVDVSKTLASGEVFRLETADNVFASPTALWVEQHSRPEWKPAREADAEALLRRLIAWSEKRNVYAPGAASVKWTVDWQPEKPHGPSTLPEWDRYWKQTGTGSLEGRVSFAGGDLLPRLTSAPLKLTPADFRLKPDSAGYQAGKDNKDLGADVDLVGPGAAYERSKRTPEYQHWLKESGQSQATPVSKPQPFVLLDVESGGEWKFATLAEAVQNAYDGDIIEVRGNGPFITTPIAISAALTIRAGDGFQPSFRLRQQDKAAMFTAYTSLVLEGLDFQIAEPEDAKANQWTPAVIFTGGRSLHIAKCRFQSRPGANHACIETSATVCVIRDSLFLDCGHVALQLGLPTFHSCTVENCVFLGNTVVRSQIASPAAGTEIKLTGNTWLALSPNQPSLVLAENHGPTTLKQVGINVIPIRATGNVSDGFQIVGFTQSEDQWKELPVSEEASSVTRMLAWQDRNNVYSVPDGQVFWSTNAPGQGPLGQRRLAEWKHVWGDPEAKCQEGRIRLRGGDLSARWAKTPDSITVEDFRLLPDSAGHGTGENGKDLGADVARVGPGAAYEDWKKTPEYVQWKKQSGQNSKGPPPESKAFALLDGTSVPERRFDTLSEAVLASSHGDTIEVRGNGPFISDAVTVNHKLAIRAGQGFRPVIRFERRSPFTGSWLLHNTAHLTLEGLEFRIRSRTDGALVHAGRTLDVANCRFYVPGLNVCIGSVAETKRCTLRNSEFVAFIALESGCQSSRGEWVIENCVYAAGAVAVHNPGAGAASGAVRISHVSVVSSGVNSAIGLLPGSLVPPEKSVDFRISESVVGSGVMLSVRRTAPALQEDGKPFTPDGIADLLPKLMSFAGTRNVYAPLDQTELEFVMSWGDGGIRRHNLKSLEAWKTLWGSPETDCIEARVKFANGDLAAKIARDLENVTPDDFRLRPDSAGYQAGKDKKDLGADVDLVGPGPAYEKWKTTSEYQKWLTDTRQRRTRLDAKPEPGEFVLLGEKGVQVGTYDTLAVAVERASDGDTIEIRGNGPFVTDPLDLGPKALTIRAGSGYAPVIWPSPAAVNADDSLFSTKAALTLEGLELHHEGVPKSGERCLIGSVAAPLLLTNCKLVVNPGKPAAAYAIVSFGGTSRGQLRNCLIVAPGNAVHLWSASRTQWEIDNCLIAHGDDNLGSPVVLLLDEENSPGTKLRLSRNTMVGGVALAVSGPSDAVAERLRVKDARAVVPVLVETEGNICQLRSVVTLNSGTAKGVLPVEEHRQFLPKLIQWRERANIYAVRDNAFLGLYASPFVRLLKDLAEWNQFWELKDTGTLQGAIIFRGDPQGLLAEAPEDITPDSFRLVEGSAGYHAGKDGKDLGADVDLVGPGPAYERWKKTPEYQQWLKETGQK